MFIHYDLYPTCSIVFYTILHFHLDMVHYLFMDVWYFVCFQLVPFNPFTGINFLEIGFQAYLNDA